MWPAQTTVAQDGVVAAKTTVRESPPASLVRAVENESGDVYAKVVFPCRDTKEKVIAAERQREESCPECQGQLPQLAIIEKQAMARCDVKGYDVRIADVDARMDAVIGRLKSLVGAFEQQARSNEVLTGEIKEGETEAEATFTEAAVGQIMDGVLNWAPERQIEKIDLAEEVMKRGRNVKYVTRGELGEFVSEIRAELRGKSKQQARAILVARLERAKLLADGIRSVNFASGQVANQNIDKAFGVKSDVSAERLDRAYGAVVTSLQIVEDQSANKLKAMADLCHVLGYSQDAVKIRIVFANLNQLEQNVDGLSSLTRAAESQRKIAKSEIDYLVQKRRILVEQRNDSMSVANGP
jgi:site-specific recombinase